MPSVLWADASSQEEGEVVAAVEITTTTGEAGEGEGEVAVVAVEFITTILREEGGEEELVEFITTMSQEEGGEEASG